MSTKNESVAGNTDRPHRGFIYFCEESLQYNKGVRAWYFFAPYLIGAVLLEPQLPFGGQDRSALAPWVILLGYLLVFPPVWRALLLRTGLWRRRSETASTPNLEVPAGNTRRPA